MAGAGRAGGDAVHAGPRHHRGDRRPPQDPERPALLSPGPGVGGQRLCAYGRRVPAAVRPSVPPVFPPLFGCWRAVPASPSPRLLPPPFPIALALPPPHPAPNTEITCPP